MTNQFISSAHIEKLDHQIAEIRERALINIISKLENGFVFDNDLARTKELLSKLFKWFLFEPCTNEELVFSLLKQTLQSESGKCILNHYGKGSIIEELTKIRSYIQPKFHNQLDDLLELVSGLDTSIIVPPLESDLPLSYRSNCSTDRKYGTTATTIEGYVQKDSSYDHQAANSVLTSHRNGTTRIYNNTNNLALCTLTWQRLIATDRHVLQSVENSLFKPPQPASLLHSCEFFTNVLLHDFPAEIFLQRPTILHQFFKLVENPSTRITNATFACLYNLTKALQVRVNHHNDPSMFNSKFGANQSSSSSRQSNENPNIDEEGEQNELESSQESESLKTNQLSIQKYALKVVYCVNKFLCAKQQSLREGRQKFNLTGINSALRLLEEIIQLILLTTNKTVWEQLQNATLRDVLTDLNEIFVYLGEVLDYFRIESQSCDQELNCRAIYLCLLHHSVNLMENFVPGDKLRLIIPKQLKISLSNALLDVVLSKLYPELYEKVQEFVESFRMEEDVGLYKTVKTICNGIKASFQLLRDYKSVKVNEGLLWAQQALPSLNFHKNISFLNAFITLCSERLQQVTTVSEDVLLRLFSHNLLEIRQETYRLCQKIVVETVGPKSVHSIDARISFLLSVKIFQEILLYGVPSDNFQIQKYAEDILILILKCKLLVSERIWNKIVQTLITVSPLLCCHATKNTTLGRTIVNLFDPDIGKTMLIPDIVILKSNIQLLFKEEPFVREEAFSRLCWLLATQPNARQTLPRLCNLYDKSLSNLFVKLVQFDVNKMRTTQHFYQPSSLLKIMDVLKSNTTEAVIKRSALAQVCVMLEDPLLHETFFEKNGVEVVLKVMQMALDEKSYENYPDSIVPAISILKCLCLYHSSVREEIGGKIEVVYSVLRGLFMFSMEERVKQDAGILLFLLIVKDFVVGGPSKGNLSLPGLVTKKIRAPFACNSHWNCSVYVGEDYLELLMKNRACMSSIQLQWNIELFGGVDELIKKEEIVYKDDGWLPTLEALKLSNYDLYSLKMSSIAFCMEKYLNCVQNGTSHTSIKEFLNDLSLYIHLHKISKNPSNSIFELPWTNALNRFLKTLPSSDEDQLLLHDVIKVLTTLVPLYKNSTNCWIIELFKDKHFSLLDLVDYSNISNDTSKLLSEQLLQLITIGVCQEQHFLNYYMQEVNTNWSHVIKLIANNLNISDAQHFYNLAYLDTLLACLVHLTASLGWSQSKCEQFQSIGRLVNDLWQLVKAFHCGKGTTASTSLMGLSITRNVMLILNHILAELKNGRINNWERYFCNVEMFRSFFTLWYSRDVILRAAVMQLFAGMAESPKLVEEMIDSSDCIYKLTINVIVDNEEANIVKENAGLLMANLLAHGLIKEKRILAMVEELNVWNCMEDILKGLYLINVKKGDVCEYSLQFHQIFQSEKSLSSCTSSDDGAVVTTPSFVKTLALFVQNFVGLVGEEAYYKLQDSGLIKLFYRCLHNPSMSLENTKELALYCSLLEMNTAIVCLLNKLIQQSSNCIGIVLHSRDCLNVLLSLLDPKVYYTHLPALLYLRNKLWSEIFHLMAKLLEMDEKSLEVVEILSDALIESDSGMFLDTLCVSLTSTASNALQNSALMSITNLLKVETCRKDSKSSVKAILDTMRSCRSAESTESQCKSSLEAIYSQKFSRESSCESINSFGDVGGCELCRILMYLYDVCNLTQSKNKQLVVSALTGLLSVSLNAKKYALKHGLMQTIFKRLKQLYMIISLESVECLRRVGDKKRICPILKELDELVGLLNNFMVQDEEVKHQAAIEGLADLIHKFWVWFSVSNQSQVNVLHLLCTFTKNCAFACKEMPLTSSGPRRTVTNASLLHELMKIVAKQMELVSKMHDLTVIRLVFRVLANCVPFVECRMIYSKCNWFQSVMRLHPALTKRQKPWDDIENIWLEFLLIFTKYPEGQTTLARISDVLELIMTLTSSTKCKNRLNALLVLRNLSIYQPNRARLLSNADFMNILLTKLANGSVNEKNAVVLMVWALSANSQKSKIVLKSAGIDEKLKNVLKHYELCKPEGVNDEEIERIRYVLSILTENSDR